MNRIAARFETLRKAGSKGLVGYLTAGDPDEATSERNVRTAIAAGLDILELGVPFSDPTADGPTIQAASLRALAAGMTLKKALALAARVRRDSGVPIVLFGYANPFFRYGYDRLCAEAAAAGVHGLLVVDLSFEETGELKACAGKHGLCLIPLIAPTTSPERAEVILRNAEGFVYYIMVTGVTGARVGVATGVADHVREIRACTGLPIAVGFGIRDGAQAREASAHADAAVVGSALVESARAGTLERLVRELSDSLHRRT